MKILIVGLGSIATRHINAIRQVEKDVRIYALRRDINASLKEGITNLYSFEDAKKECFDFAIISNPTSKHEETIDNLLCLKIPLFIEKPISHNLNIKKNVDIISRQNILTYIACDLRFLDCIRFLKENITANHIKRLNEVNVYCGSYLPEWRKTDFRKIYSAIPELGGGVHLDLIHELDYLYWILGMPTYVSNVLENQSTLQIEAIDYANYCLKYNHFYASVILNYYRRDYKRTCEFVFDDDTWITDLSKNKITSNNEMIYQSVQSESDIYLEQMKYFINLIKTKQASSFNTAQDAFNVLKICLTNNN
jgi:predicted dehydrogenase